MTLTKTKSISASTLSIVDHRWAVSVKGSMIAVTWMRAVALKPVSKDLMIQFDRTRNK